ncbi:hypothetical protein [Nocardia sp. NBC_01499]
MPTDAEKLADLAPDNRAAALAAALVRVALDDQIAEQVLDETR